MSVNFCKIQMAYRPTLLEFLQGNSDVLDYLIMQMCCPCEMWKIRSVPHRIRLIVKSRSLQTIELNQAKLVQVSNSTWLMVYLTKAHLSVVESHAQYAGVNIRSRWSVALVVPPTEP